MLRTTAALVFVAGTLSACRPARRAEAPTASVTDDLDEIEAELSRNAARLEGQGIRLAAAARTTAPTVDTTATDLAPPPEDAGGDAAAPEPDPEPASIDRDEDDAPMAPPQSAPVERDYAEETEDAPVSRSRGKLKKRRANKRDAATRCERICDLAEATCDLSDRICSLADTHVDEIRYANACQQAEAQCEAAAKACTGCAD